MTELEVKKRTRRSFIVGLIGLASAILGWSWLRSSNENDGISRITRRVLEVNGALWSKLFNPNRSAEVGGPKPSVGTNARVNGDIGLDEKVDLDAWTLQIQGFPTTFSMADLKKFPKSEAVVDFKCIEGWSEVISYAGIRFSDFLSSLQLNAQPRFVGLETPDGEYYVSVDIGSMLHPQTILAYEMNGEPLTDEHGAPLRLIIPVKYGIKSIKRIGLIAFSNTRPPDYWAEQGYDWYSGL